jgi:hypothetical protein
VTEAATWRSVLGTIISDPQERQRLADAVRVSPITLTRWATTEASPRQESLRRLLKVCPPEYASLLSRLIVQEWEDFSLTNTALDRQEAETIPSEVYADVLAIKATQPQYMRFWLISQRLVSALLEQLDPHAVGVGVTLLACTAPGGDRPVRSLHVIGGDATAPLKQKTSGVVVYLVGIESLAGYAVTHGRLYSLQQMEYSILPFIKIAGVESAVACPLRDESRIAGCLVVYSTQPNYFLPSHLLLIESYANLVALAFSEAQFYAPERIRLSVLPNQQKQHGAFSNFRERVRSLLNEAVRNQQSLNIKEAEHRVWQQLEEELLLVPFSRGEGSDTNAPRKATTVSEP